MVQHVLLLDLAPILGILGFTKVILRPVTRSVSDLERRAGLLAHPATAVVLYVGVIWVWHVPAAYDYAVTHPLVHLGEHLSFLLVGSLYWWHLLSPIRARMRLDGMGPIVYMLSTKLFVGALGMGLAFAPTALYAYYVHQPRVWGISAHDDQSIAGLIMAVEQSIVMGVALVFLFVRALAESERTQQREERYEFGPRRPLGPRSGQLDAELLQQPLHLGKAVGIRIGQQLLQLLAPGAEDLVGHRNPCGGQPRTGAVIRGQPPLAQLVLNRGDPGLLDLLAAGHLERAGDAVAVEPRQGPDGAGAQLQAGPSRDLLVEAEPALATHKHRQRAIDLGQ